MLHFIRTSMNYRTYLPIYPLIILLSFIHLFFSDRIAFAATSTTDHDDNNQFYQNCGSTFNCGSTITEIRYPFRGSNEPPYCGYPGLVLDCDRNTNSTMINIVNQKYIVLQISQSDQTMQIVREDVMKNICPSDQLLNSTLDFALFDYSRNYINVTFLYGCPINLPRSQIVVPCDNVYAMFGLPPLSIFGGCRTIVVYPVLDDSSLLAGGGGGSVNVTATGRILQQGFGIRWKVDSSACIECVSSKGRCGYDIGTSQTTCFCPDPTYLTTKGTCSLVDAGNGSVAGISPEPTAPFVGKSGKKGTSTGIVIAVVGAVLAGCIGLGWLVFYCRQRRKRLVVGSRELSITDKKKLPTTPLTNKDEAFISPSISVTRKAPSYPSTQSEFGRDTSYFGAKVFSYTELEEATEKFAESKQIGDGGFGAVYYGKLADGCIVAVKRLYENNFKRVEQFMNEVEILTRLRHSHLVTLYGCTSKRSRELLLVYEYVPNGTVADHLHGKHANSRLLSWPVRLNIAIETADALAYLHASDIIHRDVKTNNILLDNDFHVKVADFGLVRLFPNNATHVSTAPQGTPGYVDPDYYQCYQLTEKSDVYSFGVVLIELISSLQAVDTNRHRHEINLSNMAINKIQNHTLHELVDPNLQFEADTCVKRMITVVAELAFRCLQQEKDMRPSMQEVLDTLVGIKNANLGSGKVQVLSIIVDDSDHLLKKDNTSPFSPDSVTNTWASGSTKNSSG